MKVDWAIYGEQGGGHALLRCSGRRDAATSLTQYTDRPGDPPSGTDWGPAYSGYPFREHFVLVISNPARGAARAGMVTTRVAFLPQSSLLSLNDLASAFEELASAQDQEQLSPLEISEAAGDSQGPLPPEALQLIQQITEGRSGSLLWSSSAPYLDAIAAIWRAAPQLRVSITFHFQFAPEYQPPVQPLVVATLPPLAMRWSASTNSVTAQQQVSDVAHWLSGIRGSEISSLLADAGIEARAITDLPLIRIYVDAVHALDQINFSEGRRALAAALKLGAGTLHGRHSHALLNRTCQLVGNGSLGDLLSLRNLQVADDRAALKLLVAAVQQRLATLKPQELNEALDAASELSNQWWTDAIVGWAATRLGATDPNSLALGRYLVSQAKATLARRLGNELQPHEAWLKPLLADGGTSEDLLMLVAGLGWASSTAAILARLGPETDPIDRFLSFTGLKDIGQGLQELVQAIGYEQVVQRAHNTNQLRSFVESEVGRGALSLDEIYRYDRTFANEIVGQFLGTSEASSDRIDFALQVLQLIRSHPLDADPLISICLRNAPSLIPQIELTELTLSADIGAQITSVLTEQAIASNFKVLDEHRIDPGRLDLVAIRRALEGNTREAHFAISAFRMVPDLTDEDFKSWLTGYFTATSSTRVPSNVAVEIAAILNDREFPLSAAIVFDTVRQFRRADVEPILATISTRYELRDNSKLPLVLVATAIPLERKAVAQHLVTTYNSLIKADEGVWPRNTPAFRVHIITTGEGNIEAQAACDRYLAQGQVPAYSFFIGVAGSIKDNQIGDVVYATKVHYYEIGKEESGNFRSRPRSEYPSEDLVQLSHRLADTRWSASATARRAVIASGEVILASTDEEMAQIYGVIRSRYNDAQVVDMESYGFLRSMRDHNIQRSLVIRGISDEIEGKQKADAKGSQEIAATNASDFLFALLEMCRQQATQQPGLFHSILKILNPFV